MRGSIPGKEQEQAVSACLSPKQRVLICFADERISDWAAEITRGCGCEPVIYRNDLRWKSLIMTAFSNRTSVVIGDPNLILGLSKLARTHGMPLKIRLAILVGKQYGDWLYEGVGLRLDCRTVIIETEKDTRDADLVALEEHLLRWSSVLDCRLSKGEYGLEVDLVTFHGEKLPLLPTCARLVKRGWIPDADKPMVFAEKH